MAQGRGGGQPPGLPTCSGGAYTFQISGPLAAQDNVAIPMKVSDNRACSVCVADLHLVLGAILIPRRAVSEFLTSDDAKVFISLCRAGKLYEIERWIAPGKSIHTPPKTRKTPGPASSHGLNLGSPRRRVSYRTRNFSTAAMSSVAPSPGTVGTV